MIQFKKQVSFFLFLFILGIAKGQTVRNYQKIGFVDAEYIFSQLPEYALAQKQLNDRVANWKKNLDKMYLELEELKGEFLNEKPLLTEELIEEREKEIAYQVQEIQKVENTYFGTDGKLFEERKKLAIPFQNMIFNATQEIAKLKKYDIIFEKSSGLSVIYANDKADISEKVLDYITKSKEQIKKEEDAERKRRKEARLKRIEEQKRQRLERLKRNKK